MKRTSTKVLIVVALVVGWMGFAAQVSALDITSDEFMGSAKPPGDNEASEVDIIDDLAALAPGTYDNSGSPVLDRSGNTLCYPTCPSATATDSVKDESQSNSVDLGDGYTYLIGKYDGPNGASLVWYVAGLTGTIEIPASLDGLEDSQGAALCSTGECGLSHWTLYNPTSVPEPGTLMLLGGALVGLGFWARRRR